MILKIRQGHYLVFRNKRKVNKLEQYDQIIGFILTFQQGLAIVLTPVKSDIAGTCPIVAQAEFVKTRGEWWEVGGEGNDPLLNLILWGLIYTNSFWKIIREAPV